jgi:hypothetical protein
MPAIKIFLTHHFHTTPTSYIRERIFAVMMSEIFSGLIERAEIYGKINGEDSGEIIEI